MPVNNHLQWVELTDFTGGLHDFMPTQSARMLMPQNALQELVDYVPQPGGGLRPFFKSTGTVSSSGIDDVTDEVVSGLYARGGIPLRTGAVGDGTDRYVMTVDRSDFRQRLYRMDGSANATTWTKKFTSSVGASASCRQTQFAFMKSTAGCEYVVFVLRGGGGLGGSTDAGIYTTTYVGGNPAPVSDGVVTNRAARSGAMAVAQARVLVGGGNDERMYYSDVGDPANGYSSYLDIEPNKDGPNLCMIEPFAPDDLIVAKEAGPWVAISGDITSAATPVREMGQAHFMRFTEQEAVRGPEGLIFIEPGGNVWQTDGRQFDNLSEFIQRFYKVSSGSGADVVSVGRGAWLNGFLFMPHGYVLDWNTRAWFKINTTSFNPGFWHADVGVGEVWGVSQGTNFTFKKWVPFDADGIALPQRMDTGYFRTAPFYREDGRQIEIREIQLILSVNGTSNISVTVNGTTRTQTGVASGRQQLSFLFKERSEVLDVKVELTSQSSSVEAPTVERVRVGLGSGHQLA